MRQETEGLADALVARATEMRADSKIAVIIPALNEESAIGASVASFSEALRGYEHHILVVDGRSVDRTVAIAKENGATVIHQRRGGYGDALSSGFTYAMQKWKPDILLVADGDGSYLESDGRRLVELIAAHVGDYLIGRRIREGDSMSLTNAFGNKAISLLLRILLKINVHDSQSGLFAFRSYLLEGIELRTPGWAVNTELLKQAAQMDMKMMEIPITYRKRVGESKLDPIRGGMANLGVIARMMRDTEPLLLFGMLGSLAILLGLVAGSAVVWEWIVTGTQRHTATVILSVTTVTAGLQVILFGLLADMIKKRTRRATNKWHHFEEL